jgi:membrane protease YdiL (CAAX protease family)
LEPEKITTPTPFQALMIILAGFFFSIIPQLFVVILFPGPEEGTFDPLGLKISLVVGELCLAAVPFIYLKKQNLSLSEIIRWKKVPSNILWVSIPIGLGLAIVIDEIDRLLQMFIPMPEEWISEMANTMKINSSLDFILVVVSAIILAALVEEAIFRGFLQKTIEEHINVTQAVIYASLAWAIIHMNPYIAVQIFLFGFFLGYITWRVESIIPAVICHAINNALALIYFNTNMSEQFPFYEWHGHVSPILLLVAGLIAFKGIQYIDQYYRTSSLNNSSE